MARVKQIFLMVTELESSRQFYEDGLGLDPDDVGESSVAYDTGECELKIQSDFDPGVLEQFNMSPPPSKNRGSGAVRVIQADEPLADLADRIENDLPDEVSELRMEPREVPWGGRICLVADPDGYIFEIRPPAEN